MEKILRRILASAPLFLLLNLNLYNVNAIVPTPAPDQIQPIAITGAIIHIGNGRVIGDGVITFNEGIITGVGSASDGINMQGHVVLDVQGLSLIHI